MIRGFQGVMPVVPESCYVDVSAQLIGDVVLGEQASVWMNAVLRGDVNAIRVGGRSNVQDCAVLHGMRYKYPVIIGELCTIGHNATVHGCVLEDEVLVGIGAVILNNARVGTGVNYCGGRGGAGRDGDSAAEPGGGGAGEGEAGGRGGRPGADSDVWRELSGLYEDLSGGIGEDRRRSVGDDLSR